MRYKLFSKAVLALLIVAVVFPTAARASETLVLHVIGPGNGYSELALKDRIGFILSGINRFDLVWAEEEEFEALTPQERFSHGRKLDIADHYNAGYLVWVRVLEADVKTKSSTVLPFVFKSHKTKFILKTEMRIIDSRSGKIVRKKRFDESRTGDRAMSYLDLDEYNEPGLMTTYPEQLEAFSYLENRTAEKIAKELVDLVDDD